MHAVAGRDFRMPLAGRGKNWSGWTQAISFTVEYTHIEAHTLDSPAKGVTPETGLF